MSNDPLRYYKPNQQALYAAYPTDPEAQRQWVEDSIASRLADLKAKYEGPKPRKETK